MDNIMFSLSKVPDAITERTVYTAHVQTNGTVGRDELAALLAARTKQDVSLWKYFLDALSDEIGIQLLADQVVGLGLVKDLIEHAPALGQPGIGRAFPLLLFEKALNVQRFDAPERPVGEMLLEDAQGVLVVLLSGGRDVALVLLIPEVRPFGEAPELVRVQPLGQFLLVFAELGADRLLRWPVK